MPNAFVFADAVVHLADDGPIGHCTNGATFWERRNRPELDRGQIVSVFSYTTTWGYQERHPDGDELAVVLSGEIDLLLGTASGETPVPVTQGHGCIVPTGVWHRVAVHKPATIMFVTPRPSRTEHRPIADPATPPT